MIDQDYAELLTGTPPSGDVLEWTFSTRSLACSFATLLVGTPALCTVLYSSGISGDSEARKGADLRVPTLTRLGMQSPAGEIFTAGMHLAAIVALPLFWCVRLSHLQRLQARTGNARYDLEAEGAMRWVTTAWVTGALGAVCLFVAASVPGDEKTFSPQGIAHLALFLSAGVGMLGQAACTAWALRQARRVFVVSDADLVSYRRKVLLSVVMVIAAVAAVASVLLIERFVDNAWGDHEKSVANSLSSSVDGVDEVPGFNGAGAGEGRDCDVDWCYSRSTLGLWEWVFLLLEAGYCLSLRHDLAPATGGIGVESFVL